MATNLKNMTAVLVDGELYVKEADCRANLSAALASKTPLISALQWFEKMFPPTATAADVFETIGEDPSTMQDVRQAVRDALAYIDGNKTVAR